MKLYELEWGPYPRRVSIYLAEKALDMERVRFDALVEWPPRQVKAMSPAGTLPMLETDDGRLIRSSIAILEYLEERHPSPDMLGADPAARAYVRELIAAADDAAHFFLTWSEQISPLFKVNGLPQNPAVGVVASEGYAEKIRVLDRLASGGPFLAGNTPTLADCVAFANIQFADAAYRVPLPDDCRRLGSWYDAFSRRPSATLPQYPQPVLSLTQGLPEQTREASLRHQPKE